MIVSDVGRIGAAGFVIYDETPDLAVRMKYHRFYYPHIITHNDICIKALLFVSPINPGSLISASNCDCFVSFRMTLFLYYFIECLRLIIDYRLCFASSLTKAPSSDIIKRPIANAVAASLAIPNKSYLVFQFSFDVAITSRDLRFVLS